MNKIAFNKNTQAISCRSSKYSSNQALLEAFEEIATCSGNHSKLIHKTSWCKRITYFFGGMFAILLLAVWLFPLWFLRSSNHTTELGGCVLNFPWSSVDCPVAF